MYKKKKVFLEYYSTTEKEKIYHSDGSKKKDAYIIYDKQKIIIESWGKKHSESLNWGCSKITDVYEDEDEDEYKDVYEEGDVLIDNFRDELYQVFKKDKDEWNEDDLFLFKAVSDFIRLFIENIIEESEGKLKSKDQLSYLFVVPSEWEEEIRETLLRPIFIQSNLISKNDHNDRLLFCSEIESIFYELSWKKKSDFKKITKTILRRLCPISKNEMLIKLDLISTVNRSFDFPGSLLYPKVERSNSLSVTINTFADGVRDFIKDELPPSIQEEIIQIIMDKSDEKYKKEYLKKPLITDTSRWELDKRQLDFIRSICFFDICSQVCKNMTNIIDELLSNNIIKEHNFLSTLDLFSPGTSLNRNLLNWSQHLLAHNRIYSRNKYIKYPYELFEGKIDYVSMLRGAYRYGLNAIDNANIYCRPRIVPVKSSATSSSIFQDSKPDAIMNIDISIESTILSFSFLDEDGFVKEVWNHNDFLKDKSLCSLGSFFHFSEIMTLNVKPSFIEFSKDYLMDDASFLSSDKNIGFIQLNATKIETMLCKDSYTQDLSVSTQQQIYIKAFVLLYMTYIKYVISKKLSDIINFSTKIKIGYNITVEMILLDRLFGTKEDLKDIIYDSGLIQKNDNSKKLRIVIPEERIMHLLRQSFTLPFPLKSYFALAQLHEDYVQLTLNQVVTEFSSSEEDQEAIIIHEKVILISNIYTSLCLNMWNNIVEDRSLIKLCDMHQEYSDNDLLEIFSLKNKAEFAESLKQYISKNNLGNNSSQPATDKIIIQLSISCNCSVHLTVRDIIDISFQPALQDIVSLVSASFINKELFGKFWDIEYLFQLIQFDYNSQLQDSVIKMLKETTEDVMIEQKVDISHYIIPKSLNRLLQPVLYKQPVSYKEFQVGTLHHVYGDRYGFGFPGIDTYESISYKSKTTDKKPVSLNKQTGFPLFKRGDIINSLPANLTFYLTKLTDFGFFINYFKLKTPFDLNSDGTVCFDDIQNTLSGQHFSKRSHHFKTGQDIPFLISIFYEAYSGSLILRANLVGEDIGKNTPVTLGIPMHLSRF